MSSLAARITDLTTRIATECKSLRAISGPLSSLSTTDKTSLVAAVNELKLALSSSASINDWATSTQATWSSTQINLAITSAINGVVNGAGTALDTLQELATALGNDANFATSTATALANRIRYDSAQTLTSQQKTQACANLGVGEPDTDFVSTFNSGLL